LGRDLAGTEYRTRPIRDRMSHSAGITMIDGSSGEGQIFRTFWHGAPLSQYQVLCLRSFVARGHRVELFSYDHRSGESGRAMGL
jgi:hypothetical protein